MAPRVRTRGEEKAPDLTRPSSPAEQALAELRRKIESRSEDVGRNFAAEARRIHEGVSPERPIIGEANMPRQAADRGRHSGRAPALEPGQGQLKFLFR